LIENFEKLLKFFGSYPRWAQLLSLGGVLLTSLTLVLAPRRTMAKGEATPSNGEEGRADLNPVVEPKADVVFLNILGVRLFAPEAEIRVNGEINGITFKYPSMGGAEWMKVGPAMSVKHIQIPVAREYVFRFEMDVRQPDPHKKGAYVVNHATSQEAKYVTGLPDRGTYRLFVVVEGVRSDGVIAEVLYELSTKPTS
jgi:hypothetical protein